MGVILAGMKLTADRLNNITPPGLAVVTATQTNTANNTTYFDVTELVKAVEANIRYRFNMYIRYSATTVADFKVQLTGPSGADVSLWEFWGINTSGADSYGRSNAGAVVGLGGLGTGTPTFVVASGMIPVSSTAGNIQVQVAKNTAEASTLSIFTGSFMQLDRLY